MTEAECLVEIGRLQSPLCLVSGCFETPAIRGLCRRHYTNWIRHTTGKRKNPKLQGYEPHEATETLRLLSCVVSVEQDTGCWLGPSLNHNGYSRIKNGAGRKQVGHVVLYEHFIEKIVSGFELDHIICNNRSCINPWHVKQVSHRENVLRSSNFISVNFNKKECVHGHKYTQENTILIPDSSGVRRWRRCRVCSKNRHTKKALEVRDCG